jgi:hypothetical protein
MQSRSGRGLRVRQAIAGRNGASFDPPTRRVPVSMVDAHVFK